MIYNDFQELKLSLLGFGTMRLPLIPGGSGADIDQARVDEMVDYAIANGVNYFDTAYPYHESMSEIAIGKSLARYPRDKYYLATKFPGHQISESHEPAGIFEEQLKKCGVDYFDFYLLHNVNENCIDVYKDPKWGILDYFVEQKKLGRIKHLGFSCHGGLDCIEEFLDYAGDNMEFCQIQLNYMDWTLQKAKEKCELLASRGLPVWVMEPVRGGKLLEVAPASMAFRWLATVPDVTMILSGMSNVDQMKDNVSTFEELKPLTGDEVQTLYDGAAKLRNAVPCTACRYCCDGCPMGLDIPALIHSYNDMKVQNTFTPLMKVEGMPEDKRPSACIGCGRCASVCPQHIKIPQIMSDFSDMLEAVPSWASICKEREEAAETLRNKMKEL